MPRNFNDVFNNNFVTVNNTNKEVILLGDINANYLDRNGCKDLKQLIEANGFKQLIKDPTKVSNTSSTLNEKNIAKSLVACVRKVNHQRFQDRIMAYR